jgi:hypothetical protein
MSPAASLVRRDLGSVVIGFSDGGRALALVAWLGPHRRRACGARAARGERVRVPRGRPSATLRIVVSVEGADAGRLARIAETRGQKPNHVVAVLLRDADRPAA